MKKALAALVLLAAGCSEKKERIEVVLRAEETGQSVDQTFYFTELNHAVAQRHVSTIESDLKAMGELQKHRYSDLHPFLRAQIYAAMDDWTRKDDAGEIVGIEIEQFMDRYYRGNFRLYYGTQNVPTR
ncbi:MAG TPA: hypothetical protein VI612_01000 [Candidatus Nanoarchaeia archaeon]|nr:hypothetical protein [Candidatus Nanoarchaeia archaeon]